MPTANVQAAVGGADNAGACSVAGPQLCHFGMVKFATQIFAPSKATPWGSVPTANVQAAVGGPTTPAHAPSLARSFVTVLPSLLFATQIFAPSKATAMWKEPTANVQAAVGGPTTPAHAPSLARSFVNLLPRHPDIRPVKSDCYGSTANRKIVLTQQVPSKRAEKRQIGCSFRSDVVKPEPLPVIVPFTLRSLLI